MANYVDVASEASYTGAYEDGEYIAEAKGSYYGAGYEGAYVEESSPSAKAAHELPEFLKQDRLQKQLMEARQKKLHFMKYHTSPLLELVNKGGDLSKVSAEEGSWNERFQSLMDMEDCFDKYNQLRSTAHDFVHAAEAYGRIIISEMCLPDAEKTIQPKALGGIAGGQKYVVQDILFKFAVDFEGLYGGDAFAMKAAGHDFAGLMAYLSAIEMQPSPTRILHVPLMALLDFRGYRLVAICLLPIGRDSICYGSFDAGQTVHHEYAACNAAMKEVGQQLNLRGHRSPNSDELIYAPIDIEAHRGRDGKFYVLDFARYMPPQPPSGKWGGTLYELLRPELVRQSPVPLSPDAFSSFGHPDDAKAFRQDIRNVFETLKKAEPGGVIFDYAALLSSSEKNESEINESSKLSDPEVALALQGVLVRELHSRGINLRFLGLLRSFCTAPGIRLYLLQQSLARLWKREMQHLWRDTMRSERSPSEEPFRKVTARFLNLLLQDAQYWATLKERLMDKFPGALTDAELDEACDLRQLYPSLFQVALPQLLVFVKVELDRSTYSSLQEACRSGGEALKAFEFVAGDVVSLGCQTRHISTVDKADAYAHMYHAQTLGKDQDGLALRLLTLAQSKLLTAMKAGGSDMELQYRFCFCRVELFRLQARNRATYHKSECVDALSALTKKLEASEPPSALLPQTKLLESSFLLLQVRYRTSGAPAYVDVVAAATVALDCYNARMAHVGDMVEEQQVMQGKMPFLKHCYRILVRAWRNYADEKTVPVLLTLSHRLIDELIPIMRFEKVLRQQPQAGVWLWWALVSYARAIEAHHSMQLPCGVPLSVVPDFFSDAAAFLVQALGLEPSLRAKFTRVLNVKNARAMLPWLELLESSEVVFSACAAFVAEWTTVELIGERISSPQNLTRLLTVTSAIAKLNLRRAEGVDVQHVLTVLQSPVRQTLKSLSLPDLAENGFHELAQFKEMLPALTSLHLRHTAADNAAVAALIGLCPQLTKLDVSCSRVTLAPAEGEVALEGILPDGLVKLDLGYPSRPWRGTDLARLLRGPLLARLQFLGLAGTAVTDLQLEIVLEDAVQLQSLDLFRCVYVNERSVRVAMTKPNFSSTMKEVWLPSGAWFPCFNSHNEEVVVNLAANRNYNRITIMARGRRFAQVIPQGNVSTSFTAQPFEGSRSLHRQVLGFVRELDVPQSLSTKFNILRENRGSFTWYLGPEEHLDFFELLVTVHTAPKMPGMARVVPHFLQPFTFEGEMYVATGRANASTGKVEMVQVDRKATNESSSFFFGRGGLRTLKMKAFPGVSPFVFVLALFILTAKQPKEMDGIIY